MKTLVLFSLSVAVILAMPPFAPGVAHDPDLTTEEQPPLVADWEPVQGHVEVEVPAPQARLVKVEPHDKVEQEGVGAKVRQEAKVEQTFEAAPEVKVEQEVKEQEVKVEPEVKVEENVKVEQEVKAEQEVKVEQGVKEQEVKSEPEVKEEQEVKVEQEVKEQDVKVEQEVKAEPEGEPEPQVKVDQEPIRADSEFKVESEVKVEAGVQLEPELIENPMFDEEFQVQMNLEAEAEPGQEVEERHMDMERNYEIIDEPVMYSEPQDDVSMFREEGSDAELLEMEKSLRAAFQSQYSAVEPRSEEEVLVKKDEELIMELEPEMRSEQFQYQEAIVEPLSEEEGLMKKDEEPVMELEHEMRNEPFQSQEVVPDAAIMEQA